MVNHDHFEEGGYAAGYIRVSPANQDVQRSVAAQKELIQEFVQEHVLETSSGTSTSGTASLSLP